KPSSSTVSESTRTCTPASGLGGGAEGSSACSSEGVSEGSAESIGASAGSAALVVISSGSGCIGSLHDDAERIGGPHQAYVLQRMRGFKCLSEKGSDPLEASGYHEVCWPRRRGSDPFSDRHQVAGHKQFVNKRHRPARFLPFWKASVHRTNLCPVA